jgi:hypothetical protein
LPEFFVVLVVCSAHHHNSPSLVSLFCQYSSSSGKILCFDTGAMSEPQIPERISSKHALDELKEVNETLKQKRRRLQPKTSFDSK